MPTAGETDYLGSRAFERHVSRYVQSQPHRFAVTAPPELADICRGELQDMGFQGTEPTRAGVEFEGRLESCYLANLRLRTASRILCRLPSFRAGTTEELFHKGHEDSLGTQARPRPPPSRWNRTWNTRASSMKV